MSFLIRETYAVGDKVIMEDLVSQRVGTVIRISPKRGDITVSWGVSDGKDNTETFDRVGRSRGTLRFHDRYITHYTEQIKNYLEGVNAVRRFKHRYEQLSRMGKFTPELARKLLEIIDPVWDEQVGKGETDGQRL